MIKRMDLFAQFFFDYYEHSRILQHEHLVFIFKDKLQLDDNQACDFSTWIIVQQADQRNIVRM